MRAAEHHVLATFGRDVPVDAATRRTVSALQRAWERDWPLARDLIVGLARAWGAQRLAQEWPTVQACVLNVSDEAEAGAVLREVLGVFARSRLASTVARGAKRARARLMREVQRAGEDDLVVYPAIAKSHLAVEQIVAAMRATADAEAEALAARKAAAAAPTEEAEALAERAEDVASLFRRTLQRAIEKGRSSGSDLVRAQAAVALASTPAQDAAAAKRLDRAQSALAATEAQAVEMQEAARQIPQEQARAAAEALRMAQQAQRDAEQAVAAAMESGEGLASAKSRLAIAQEAVERASANLAAARQALDAYAYPGPQAHPALGPSPAAFREESAAIAASMFAAGPPPPGSGPTKSKTAFNLYDKRVAEHLASDTTFWVGSAWDQSLGRQIARTVERAMESGKGRTAAGLALALEAGLAKFDKPSWYWETVASAAMVRARSVGSVAGFRAAGVQTFRFVNPGDERTSTICRTLNGTVFTIRHAEGMLARALADETPEGHKKAWPWPPPSEAQGKSADQLAARGIVLPPLHGRCRSRVIAQTFSPEFVPFDPDAPV